MDETCIQYGGNEKYIQYFGPKTLGTDLYVNIIGLKIDLPC
jgi:hypothetical protein